MELKLTNAGVNNEDMVILTILLSSLVKIRINLYFREWFLSALPFTPSGITEKAVNRLLCLMVVRSHNQVVSFPAPNNPSEDRLQYLAGKEDRQLYHQLVSAASSVIARSPAKSTGSSCSTSVPLRSLRTLISAALAVPLPDSHLFHSLAFSLKKFFFLQIHVA